MKNRNVVSLRTNASDSLEVYTANTTPDNHDIHISQKIPIPTIRLTQATPSDTSVPSIIAPKSSSPRKKIVPKKSKLALLSAKTVPPRERDLSDVLRRVNASATDLDGNATCNVTVNGGTTMKMKDILKFKDHSSRSTIDIYVDPANDPDIGEIVVIKKKKSRAKLDGLFDDKNAEVKEGPKEESKWWSIRGRKKDRLRNDSLNALKINVTEASTVFPEARQRCGSTPLSPPDSGHADSMALRAMKSIARIGSWAQLKNSLPRDLHQAPSDSRVKTSISSFEVGALSTHTTEDLTNRLSPMRFSNRVPSGSHKFLNPSITNTSVRSRTASCGTVLSVTSTGYLQPYDNRCLSISSSSGESNRPGSTYTASGEDTGALGIPAKSSSSKSKKGIGVNWGSVSSALVLSKGKKKSETLLEKGKAKVKASISKSDKRLSTAHSSQDVKENIPPTAKENEQRKLQNSHRHTVEGRRRTHVRSIFPGLSFGRSADLNAASIKTSMPPIAEDPSRSRDDNLLHQVIETLSGESAAGILKGTVLAKDTNIDELSDSDSDLSNRYIIDEEPCVRLNVKHPRCETQQFILKRILETDGETDLVKARPRPRSASEHLLNSNRVTQRSRPVGIVVDSDLKHGDGQDVLSLSVLEAANSDLASLINRLDLEATPDKNRDITSETIAAWKASSSAAPPSAFKSSTQAKTCHGPVEMSPVNYPLQCSPSDIRCSVFRGNGQSLETEDVKLMYRDPIAFLDPTMDSAIGESFAFINNNNGIASDDSPLRYMGKVRAMTRAMGAAAEAAGGTMSKGISAISAGTRASVTSLRPYALSAFRNKDENIKDVFTKGLQASSTVTISPEVEQERPRAPSRQSMELKKQSGDFGCLLVHDTGVSSASSTQNLELSSKRFVSDRTSCTSSVVSTFGTRSVLAKMRGTELEELMPGNTSFESGQAGDCKTFNTGQTSLTYALPSLDSADGSPVSLYASQFGIEDTPTRPVSMRGHIRRSSELVPISQRPIPRGSNVRCKVEFIERLTRIEHDQEEQARKKIVRKGAVKCVAESNHLSAFSRRSHSSASSYSPSSDEGISVSTSALRTRRNVERSAHSSLNFDEDEHLYSDVPGELKDVLSANIQFSNDSFSSSYHAPSLSSALSTSGACNLPPSPGLPPTGPLPIPESSKSLIIPTPPSTNSLKVTIESSPPAPSLLPVIDPSPSPKTSKASLSLPVLRIVPPHREQSLSEGGDIDGSMPRVASQSALSTFGSGSDDDTKQSFDFTGELKRLNESGGSNRLSFVEQLDAAFKTPPHVTVRGGVGIKTTAAKGMIPILIPLEAGLDLEMEEGLSMMVESLNESMNNLGFETSRSSEALISPQTSGEVVSKPSYGRLDTAFKFGGRPGAAPSRNLSSNDSLSSKLSNVVSLGASPSQLELEHPRRRPSISIPPSLMEEDGSVLRSNYIHARANEPTQPVDITLPEVGVDRRVSSRASDIESDTSSKRRIRETTKAKLPTHERQSSDISFLGFSSFGAIRTKFEFGPDRPDFYSSMQASQTSIPNSHFRHESLFSIASVSSYGEVIKPGMADPFNYGPFEDEAQDQLPGLDSFSDRRRSKRFSTDSDMSSFYFKPGDGCSHHTRNQSVLSTNSANGPPISLYNRTFNQGHRRNDSGGSMSSIAAAYSVQGANGGRAAWMRHQQEQSVDSVVSDFSRMRLGRPGVGDKMFESIGDHYPLTSITASPPESVSGDLAQKSSYDSILDEERRSTVDSIFDNTGHRSSVSSDSAFWQDPANENEQPHDNMIHQNLLPSTSLFRPLSFTSAANHETSREDDTMITMLGGEHVRRRSLGSSFEASPCFRVEKQKRGFCDDRMKIHYTDDTAVDDDEGLMVDSTSPTAKIGGHSVPLMHAQSGASVRSIKFGETRMNLARNGLLHRESLEGNCLSADGEEDVSMVSTRSKGFSRPAPRRQRKPVVTITQPPDTTPPLSSSDGSGESQSSIDVERLKVLLHTAADETRSSASRVHSGARIRAPGQGHRRRASQVSKGSVFGTIQEETSSEFPRLPLTRYTDNGRRKRDSSDSNSTYSSEPLRTPLGLAKAIAGKEDAVFEPHIIEHQGWDEERWVVGLRRYYALRSEADEEIKHSRTTWPDTHFSLHALNTFVPPRDPAVMQALLEHSVKNYVPLPIDRHPRRIRSRAQSISRSPPFSRSNSISGGSARSKKSHARSRSRSSIDTCTSSTHSHALRPKCVNNMPSPHPMLVNVKPYSPFLVDLGQSKNTYSEEESFVAFAAIGEEPTAPLNVTKPDVRRPRVPSATRRSALGWSKRKTTKDDGNNKENETHGLLVSPSESLRIVRPRPRSRVVNGHINVASRPIGMLS